MSQVYTFRRRIEFRETDMAGIVHFSNFFAYMEQAEHDFLRSVGMGVICEADGKKISWPRTKSVTYAFDFYRDETQIADGKMTAVCCLFSADSHGKKPESIAIPPSFIKAISPFATTT